MSISNDLNARLHNAEAALVGFADLSEVPADARQNLPRGVAVAVSMTPDIVRGIADMPTQAYYDEYNRLNALLDSLVTLGADMLIQRGYHAVAQTRDSVHENGIDYSTPLPHKTVATRAGLGWIGKCAVLVTREYGSAVRISTLLTDAPLETARPFNTSRCGTCTACAAACPGHAVVGPNWTVNTPRSKIYDANLCRTTARARSMQGYGVSITLCGKCIEVCPWTRRYLNASQPNE